MFISRIYYTIEVFLAFGILLRFADAKSIAQHTEQKDIRKPVDQLNHDNENGKFHNNFHKRQIAPEFTQLGQTYEPQYFQQPFLPASQSPFPTGQFFNQFGSQDEEERFFLNQESTTLNPLSFGNPPPPSTQNPLQQQLADEQRRFQQEIADQGLREQQEKSFGVPRPSTTTPPPAPQPAVNPFFQQFDPQGQFLFGDPSAANPQAAQLPQDGLFGADFNSQQAYYPTVREFRSISEKSPRSIDRQLGSHNDLGFFSSTVSPRPLFDNLIQHSTPKEDLTQIGTWLIDNLTKQIQRNLAGFTKAASKRHQHSTPRPTSNPGIHYSTPSPFQGSTKSPLDFDLSYSTPASNQHSTKSPVDFQHPYFSHTTSKPTPNFDFQYSTEAPVQVPIYQSTPVYQSTTGNVDLSSYPNWNSIRGLENIATSTPSYLDQFDSKRTPSIDQYENFEPKRVKSVQILPFSSELPNYQTTVKPYDNSNVYQAYKQVYDIDQQTSQPITSTSTPSFLQIINSRPSSDGISVASLFRSKLNEMKENEKSARQAIPQIKILERGYSEFQQHDKFFDQLQQNNTYANANFSESTTASYDNPSTAIFIKVPEEPTSTVGFLFDKTITKNIHKKENSPSKHKNNVNRSPQIIKSSLVYRTPPGKRATVSRSEISQNNKADSGLLTNLLLGDSSKSLRWLLGNSVPTTTSRPFVTALLNFIQKRAAANDSDDTET